MGLGTKRRPDSFVQRAANYFGMPSRAELIVASSLSVLLIAFRITNILRLRFDSDEPAHLHIVWAWTRDLVQYRDIFSNHMPLFHLLCAPIYALVGERATALFWMRFSMQPFYFVAAWCTYRIGERLFSRRVGVWALILTACSSTYHFSSCQFRTDNLWALLYLLCVLVLVSKPPRPLVAGLLLGLSFAVSLKSALLLCVLATSLVAASLLARRESLKISWQFVARDAAAFIIGTLIVPVTIGAFFAWKGVWSSFRYYVVDYNLLPNLEAPEHPLRPVFIFIFALPFFLYCAHCIIARAPEARLGFSRAWIFLFCAFYPSALYGIWGVITRQDFLPWYPLVFIWISSALFEIADHFETRRPVVLKILRYLPLPALIATTELFFAVHKEPFWTNGAKEQTDLLRGILALTNPGDYVFDCKGETVFRNRCTRLVMETITRRRIERGMIVDDVPQRCVETHACVAVLMKGYVVPPEVRSFVERNYLPVGRQLRVAGARLDPTTTPENAISFEVVIPASYKIVARDGPVTGALDGSPYDGARFLSPGKHTFAQTSAAHDLAVLWSQAVDRGFTPSFE